MANRNHIKWLLEGVEAWNKRREKNVFRPDFISVDIFRLFSSRGMLDERDRIPLDEINLSFARLDYTNLNRANLRKANLHGADLGGSTLTNSDLRGANLHDAKLRTKGLLGVDVRNTDLSESKHLLKSEYHLMRGDETTVLPERLPFPVRWHDKPSESDKPERFVESPLRYTPPAEFQTHGWRVYVQHKPERAVPRKASSTPIDLDAAEKLRSAFSSLAGTFCTALRKYKRENEDQSNRVRPAEQILITAQALLRTAEQPREDFLPTLFEDYLEVLAAQDDIMAFEQNDVALHSQLVKRGRQLYAFYPEILEASDPTNTRFITDDFPYDFQQLHSELSEIVYSPEGLEHFSDTTRELIQAEVTATVPKESNAEKTKLSRLSAIVGEMKREMENYADKARDLVNYTESWIKIFKRVEKIWNAIKEFVGIMPEV